MSDKKDTAASLGHSEELSVKHSPCKTIPEFIHLPEEGTKGSSFVLRQNSGDVFPKEPSGLNFPNSSYIFEHELTPRVQESLSLS